MPSPDPANITPRNRGLARRLAFLIASGRSLHDSAQELSIPYRTAKRWHRNPKFKLQVDRLQCRWVAEASASLIFASTAAVNELVRLMKESRDESIRLRAARSVLEKLPEVSSPLPPKPIAEMTDSELERYATTGTL
jgi:hypothetical protein